MTQKTIPNLLLLLLLCAILSWIFLSCSPSRDLQEGVKLMPGTIADNHYSPCSKVVSIERTMRGFKHTFVSQQQDTLIRYLNMRLIKDSCYRVVVTP